MPSLKLEDIVRRGSEREVRWQVSGKGSGLGSEVATANAVT